MASDSAIEVLQGELERLFELGELKKLSADVLGFDPERVGGTASKGAFARSLVGHCVDEDAIDALVDAILFTSSHADTNLRSVMKSMPNGELRPGTLVGGLRVVKKIGEGDLSVVYLAEGSGEAGEIKRAALKVIRSQFSRDRAAVHRFTTMSRFMQSLRSPGLAPILGVGRLDDARPWVAAAYLGGQTLAQRIERSGSLHINEARSIFAGVLAGLAALHERGLVHGDVRAENVFVVRDDGATESTGVLVDAGSDRLFSSRSPSLTAKASGLSPVLGIAKSVAPEQALGLEPDARTDIYQLGALMYETLAGRPPFHGKSAIDLIAQHVSAAPEPPSTYARKGWVSPRSMTWCCARLPRTPSCAGRTSTRWPTRSIARRASRACRGRSTKGRSRMRADRCCFTRATRARPIAWKSSRASPTRSLAPPIRCSRSRARRATATAACRCCSERRVSLPPSSRTRCTPKRRISRCWRVDPESEIALNGIEAAKRAAGDHEGLISAAARSARASDHGGDPQSPAARNRDAVREAAARPRKRPDRAGAGADQRPRRCRGSQEHRTPRGQRRSALERGDCDA